jgi:hypothetical protein
VLVSINWIKTRREMYNRVFGSYGMIGKRWDWRAALVVYVFGYVSRRPIILGHFILIELTPLPTHTLRLLRNWLEVPSSCAINWLENPERSITASHPQNFFSFFFF